jgi:hypothetical protein
MKIKTSELSGAALDWAVAMAENNDDCRDPYVTRTYDGKEKYVRVTTFSGITTDWEPSTDWAQGGPLIERGLLVLSPDPSDGWRARSYMDLTSYKGPTPLQAAMRCYVASQLGDTVDIPPELTK